MEGIVKKLDTKTLTGRYDMKQLIKVQQVEQWQPAYGVRQLL